MYSYPLVDVHDRCMVVNEALLQLAISSRASHIFLQGITKFLVSCQLPITVMVYAPCSPNSTVGQTLRISLATRYSVSWIFRHRDSSQPICVLQWLAAGSHFRNCLECGHLFPHHSLATRLVRMLHYWTVGSTSDIGSDTHEKISVFHHWMPTKVGGISKARVRSTWPRRIQ